MLKVCSTGLTPESEPVPRFGRDVDVGVAIPIMLGGGASGAGADFVETVGALPPFTMSAFDSGFSGAVAVEASDVDSGFNKLRAGRESLSSTSRSVIDFAGVFGAAGVIASS